MKVIYQLEVGNKGNSRNVSVCRELPFIPHAGMQIIAVKNDDYRRVEDVFYDSTTGILEVYFEFQESVRLKDLLRLGWLIDEN